MLLLPAAILDVLHNNWRSSCSPYAVSSTSHQPQLLSVAAEVHPVWMADRGRRHRCSPRLWPQLPPWKVTLVSTTTPLPTPFVAPAECGRSESLDCESPFARQIWPTLLGFDHFLLLENVTGTQRYVQLKTSSSPAPMRHILKRAILRYLR